MNSILSKNWICLLPGMQRTFWVPAFVREKNIFGIERVIFFFCWSTGGEESAHF